MELEYIRNKQVNVATYTVTFHLDTANKTALICTIASQLGNNDIVFTIGSEHTVDGNESFKFHTNRRRAAKLLRDLADDNDIYILRGINPWTPC